MFTQEGKFFFELVMIFTSLGVILINWPISWKLYIIELNYKEEQKVVLHEN